jgi:hypothetical protein
MQRPQQSALPPGEPGSMHARTLHAGVGGEQISAFTKWHLLTRADGAPGGGWSRHYW